MDFDDLKAGQLKAIVNRLGGVEAAQALLRSSGINVVEALSLKAALQRNNWTDADISHFSEGDGAKLLLPVVRGYGKVELLKIIIDLSAPAMLPKEWREKNWEVIEHIAGPTDFEWDPEKVKPWLSIQQEGDKRIEGNTLLKEIRKRGPTFNANMLDWCLAHPNLVPEDWQMMFLWDTLYLNRPSGDQCVRYLCLDSRGPRWGYRWLNEYWYLRNPAAAPAGF